MANKAKREQNVLKEQSPKLHNMASKTVKDELTTIQENTQQKETQISIIEVEK